MFIVIADDITGAAEIAGIAHSRGLHTQLMMSAGDHDGALPDVLVMATDTRSMSEEEAVTATLRLADGLRSSVLSRRSVTPREGTVPHPRVRLFKKTDSALRGHVMAELRALMQSASVSRVVYMPANPSKGRIIRAGTYYIYNDGGDHREAVPIAATAFSYDPEFPARTSSLRERFPQAGADGILMPDAESESDIRHLVASYDDGQTLFAGAADLFTALLDSEPAPSRSRLTHGVATSHAGIADAPSRPAATLVLCGSTQSRPADCGMTLVAMPRGVYDGGQSARDWFAAICAATAPPDSLVLYIPHRHLTGKAVAVRLRTVMAEVTRLLVARHRPDHLIIEGGATAWATLQSLGWNRLSVVRQLAPGVVRLLTAGGTVVTLKPGSYPWGDDLMG